MNEAIALAVTYQARAARAAWPTLARSPSALRVAVLSTLADLLQAEQLRILEANRLDIEAGMAAGLDDALIDRLRLDEARLAGVVADLRGVARLPDPLAQRFDERTLDNGLRIARQRVPLGVLGVIYESRPNVTIDVAGLALMSGNAVLLRGGRETLHSNRALVACIHQALRACEVPEAVVQFIDRADRESVLELLECAGSVDLIIPRGGQALQSLCLERSRIPVVTGGIGICHLYVDRMVDVERALPVIENAKVQRPTVCNALDTLLVHRDVAAAVLPRVVERLGMRGVSFRAEPRALSHVEGVAGVQSARPEDFDTEWLSLVLGLKVVDDMDQAIAHIGRHGTGHSDGILSDDPAALARFLADVDSAAVYANASTRFTDGAQFGLGAEVAVSTQRVQARGPMGLAELTTYKWVVEGDYHTRE
ncbi:MAG TPA: glutamate-5-semialdehyde dehydrogenase [Xanthomonadaceae bacterium]|nr:glutamate-5-semialdehyde dehydrogenase [Xanthomonadaceae bacterium]